MGVRQEVKTGNYEDGEGGGGGGAKRERERGKRERVHRSAPGVTCPRPTKTNDIRVAANQLTERIHPSFLFPFFPSWHFSTMRNLLTAMAPWILGISHNLRKVLNVKVILHYNLQRYRCCIRHVKKKSPLCKVILQRQLQGFKWVTLMNIIRRCSSDEA